MTMRLINDNYSFIESAHFRSEINNMLNKIREKKENTYSSSSCCVTTKCYLNTRRELAFQQVIHKHSN